MVIVCGLQCPHNLHPPIVHGDLKGVRTYSLPNCDDDDDGPDLTSAIHS